ncbi:MAG: hypothetical protein ACP5PX_02490 [Candidatus Hadarchaeum sp.]|uniref:hypothetical protein n=1 Tax=Candidatus Hadarchaeum sp. TaxID=2883567 RepID=UPI003D11BEDA
MLEHNINAVDSVTKFNLGTKLVKSRRLEEFDEFFKGLKNRAGGQIRVVFWRESQKPPRRGSW